MPSRVGRTVARVTNWLTLAFVIGCFIVGYMGGPFGIVGFGILAMFGGVVVWSIGHFIVLFILPQEKHDGPK